LKLIKNLEKKTTAQLHAMLKKLDPKRAKTIDANNPRRLIRAIEIVKQTGKPVPDSPFENPKKTNSLILGITLPQEKLFKLIDMRL
jgi:tRNA dimethylallyltransferase